MFNVSAKQANLTKLEYPGKLRTVPKEGRFLQEIVFSYGFSGDMLIFVGFLIFSRKHMPFRLLFHPALWLSKMALQH